MTGKQRFSLCSFVAANPGVYRIVKFRSNFGAFQAREYSRKVDNCSIHEGSDEGLMFSTQRPEPEEASMTTRGEI